VSGPLSSFPLGLLSLFGVKQQGQYPRTLIDSIQPTMDMLEFVACTNADDMELSDIVQLNGAGTGSGGRYTTGLYVPDNEVWLLTDFSVTGAVRGTGGTIPGMMLGWISGVGGVGGNQWFYERPTPTVVWTGISSATEYAYSAQGFRGLCFLPPRSELTVLLTEPYAGVAGGDLSIQSLARWKSMRV